MPASDLIYKAQTRWLFHSHVKVKIPSFCNDSLFDVLYSELESVDKKYNSYSADSYIDQINRLAGSFVEVDDSIIDIIRQVKRLSYYFDGEYDITIMPLLRLWQFYKDENKDLPSIKEIESVLCNIDYKKIEENGRRIRIGRNQEIVTGSFIKAYAVDRLVEKMHKEGITDAIINAGGSTIKAVNNILHPFWQIDVTHPDDENRILFQLKIANACYSTSAQSKSFVEIDGQHYGHIISPKTGYPSRNKQVGIITPYCFDGDIISTGIYNLTLEGFERKMNELSELFPVSGFMMDDDGKIKFAGDFEKYVI